MKPHLFAFEASGKRVWLPLMPQRFHIFLFYLCAIIFLVFACESTIVVLGLFLQKMIKVLRPYHWKPGVHFHPRHGFDFVLILLLNLHLFAWAVSAGPETLFAT